MNECVPYVLGVLVLGGSLYNNFHCTNFSVVLCTLGQFVLCGFTSNYLVVILLIRGV